MPSGYLNLMVDPHLISTTYEQGDIIEACNHIAIRRMASHRICFERNQRSRQFANRNGSGFLPHSHLLKQWHDTCCEFRLERLNRNQCKMIRLSDMEELVITTGVSHTDLRGQPNKQMDVQLYFKSQLESFKRQSAQGRAIFSDDGNETKVVLYGGKTKLESAEMDSVWTAITNDTGRTEANEITYDKQPPFGPYEKKQIVLRVNDFTDVESTELTISLTDGDAVIKNRKSFVDWENDLGLSTETKADIRDGEKNPDLRTSEETRSTIVTTKSI